MIRDTHCGARRTQTVGILVKDRVGPVSIQKNRIEASTAINDRRQQQRQFRSPK
ncbi:MAG: hypothetical protein ACLQVF_28020 [Isosphaeraceae bacterium]